MARLFVAVSLPDAVRDYFRSLKKDISGLKWMAVENMHLTLRFIGDVHKEQFACIKDAFHTVRASSFPVQITNLGVFKRSRQSILWVGLESSPTLLDLKFQVDSALCAAGLAPSQGTYTPHITLGRMKASDLTTLRTFAKMDIDKKKGAFSVMNFTLFSSLLTSTEAIHTPLETYSLK